MTTIQKLSVDLKTYSEESHKQFNNQSSRGTINKIQYEVLIKDLHALINNDAISKSLVEKIQNREDRKYIEEHFKEDKVDIHLFRQISNYVLWLEEWLR